ncbi:AAA family ATPase [Alcaligenaceae bacterium]|nr:AAA family ATPase [Alcaligenaceae bacterium]
MRFKRLDLIRYGKFTDRRLEFPFREADFHLVIGPNEAGKSTFRTAVLDLLFGFPLRTPLDFLHAKADLLLGAAIEREGTALEFLRRKANRNTLRTPDEAPLPDGALDSWLGGAHRAFFDKMFGLDHERLVAGGNSILNAQDDVGQVLFQSASGIASLGKVRDALEAEADALWAPTKSSKRVYYAARDLYDQASSDLKNAIVRTRDWASASERVQALSERSAEHRREQSARQETRARLERLRRVIPLLHELEECERELKDLDGVALLPSDAAQVLAQAQLSLARAGQRLEIHRGELDRLNIQASALQVDDKVLSLSEDIESLDALRHRYAGHEAAIIQAEGQSALLHGELMRMAKELGWQIADPAAPDALSMLRERMPGLPLRERLGQLLREHETISLAIEAADAVHANRLADAQALDAKLKNHAAPEPGADLRSALAQAQSLGDAVLTLSRADLTVRRRREALEQSMARLGSWKRAPDALAAVVWPTPQSVAAWLAERQSCQADLKSISSRRADKAATVQRLSLSIEQFQRLHQPVTQEDVIAAREQRNAVWRSIREGGRPLAASAEAYEAKVQHADALADQRHDKAREAAEFQALEQQLEQERAAYQDILRRHEACASALEVQESAWRERSIGLALDGMALEEFSDWLARKDAALDAAGALALAQEERDALAGAHSRAKEALGRALLRHGHAIDADAELADLRTQAQVRIREADDARVLRQEWEARRVEARPMLQASEQAAKAARGRLEAWHAEWREAATRAGLAEGTSIGEAVGALQLLSGMVDRLDQLQRLRQEQIDARRGDLHGFTTRAVALCRAADLAVPDGGVDVEAAFAMSRELMRRVAQARQAQEHAAVTARAIQEEQAQLRAAEHSAAEAQAQLQPLLESSGSNDPAALALAIARSDRLRALKSKLQGVQKRLAEDSDGISRERLLAEMAEVDAARLQVDLAAIQEEMTQAQEQQNALAVELAQAEADLASIAGSDDAARAEARRQEALATMADAASRYVKVYTAARLLRWSIDRYREEKQGPVLARASDIFSKLTLGAFERLRVDFEREPMALQGQRADGRLVGIEGLSDGTRDQLYLALRLAALELHLEQSAPLPFIADDLFINYDDARAEAGLRALADLSRRTQVIFLSHHDHIEELARSVFGDELNVIRLERQAAPARGQTPFGV